MTILKNGGRGEERAADGVAFFPALSPTLYPTSGSSTETEDVEEEKLWLIDDDSNYGNNKVSISFSSSDSRGNGYGGGVGVSGGSLSLSSSSSSSSSSQSSSSSSLSSGLIKSEIRCSPLSVKSSNKVAIKEESIEAVDEVEGGAWGYSYGCNRSFSSSTHADFPKPMEGLHETGPPPFLKKTFEMVEDPESDPIVSWNQGRDSFIVWDCHELSKNLLPKYFKHSNFSSFIRQLNTYGFRKIDTDRWEFANEGFLGGKKHLLKTIKRRSRFNKQQLMVITSLDLAKSGVGGELETLKKDQTKLKVKILKLRQEHEESQNRLTAVEERIRGAECKQQQMLSFLIKMAKTPSFVHQLMQKRVRKNGLDFNEFCKRPRLLSPGDLEILTETSTNAFQSVECNNLVEKELNTSQSDLTVTDMFLEPEVLHPQETPLQSFIDDKSCSSLQGQRASMVSIANNEDSSSAYRMMSDNLLGGNPIVDSELTGNDFKFYLELEDLVRKPHDWGGYISSHMA